MKKRTIGNSEAPAPPTIIVAGGNNNMLGWIFAALGISTGVYFLNKHIQNKKGEAEGEKVGEFAEASAASSITQAVNPSGISWLKHIDGTNAVQIMKSIENAIRSGKTYKEISNSYKKLTKGGNLQDDMQNSLSASQYQTFLNVIKLNAPGGNANTSNFKNPVNKGETISSAVKLTIRKTPYLNGNLTVLQNRGNAIEYVENPGTFIGLATGKYKTTTSRDTLLADKASQSTVFYEVVVAGNDKKPYTVWVAASLIKVHPKGTRPDKFNRAYLMNVQAYQKAQAVNAPSLEGLFDVSKLML